VAIGLIQLTFKAFAARAIKAKLGKIGGKDMYISRYGRGYDAMA
jgi:hypothetical protein